MGNEKITIKPGIYYDIPFDEYKKWEGIHKSQFKSILRSGLQFKHDEESEEKETELTKFGNLVDTILFEPSLFSKRYVIIPETYISEKDEIKPWNWNANVCKRWRDEITVGDNPPSIIKSEDELRALNIVTSIKKHPQAQEWLNGASVQVSMVWIDPSTGLLCKGRMDALKEDRIIDLKVTDDPLPHAFSSIVNRFQYHAQGAFYHDGYFLSKGVDTPECPAIPFSFIAAESEPPHDVVCYNLGLESFECGKILYREALLKYKEMVENDEYCGYSNVAEDIEIPMWARNRLQLDGVIE